MMLFSKSGYCSGVIWILPIKILKRTVAIPILIIIPKLRMVPTEAEAIPKKRFSTELMMAFVLGEEKRAKPKPSKIRQPIMYPSGVFGFKKISRNNPMVVSVIPTVATIRGSIRSESFPA